MKHAARLVSRLSGFALATALTGAVGFATIPALIAASGASTWSVVAFGQAVGVLGTMLIGWGWGLSGAAEAALATDADDLLLRSIAVRSRLVAPVGLLGGGIAWLLAPQDPWLAAMSAVAYSLSGMTAQWFYTGVRAPEQLILREVLPRTALIVVGLIVCGILRSSYPFPVFLAAGVLLGVVLNARGAGSTWLRAMRSHGHRPTTDLRRHFPQLVSTLVSTTYLTSPTVLVGVLAPRDLVAYALADRLYRSATMAVLPILNVLQGAIPTHDAAVFRRRVRKGVRSLLALGLVGAVAFAVGAPLIAPLLTGGEYGLPHSITVPFGVTLMATTLSQVVGLSILVTLGRVRSVVLATLLGAGLGVPVLVVGTLVLGATGAAVGLAVAEGAMTVYQLWSMRTGIRRLSTGAMPALPRPDVATGDMRGAVSRSGGCARRMRGARLPVGHRRPVGGGEARG